MEVVCRNIAFGSVFIRISGDLPTYFSRKNTLRSSCLVCGLRSRIQTASRKPLFRYTFPFEGNWNEVSSSKENASESSDIPSRLKGIETVLLWSFEILKTCSDIPSRLKGIETKNGKGYSFDLHVFRYTFPFEGNWNSPVRSKTAPKIPFRYTFPFEGNWNCRTGAIDPHRLPASSSDIPSRLKGIETIPYGSRYRRWRERSDIPSRLKGIETDRSDRCPFSSVCSDIPSRLKGIETICSFIFLISSDNSFRYTFPFEGNWNSETSSRLPSNTPRSDIPSRLKGIETDRLHRDCLQTLPVQIYLPVWRELKPSSVSCCTSIPKGSDIPSRLKGIETDGSFLLFLLCDCSDIPSRLKGIETLESTPLLYLVVSSDIPSRLKGIETLLHHRRRQRHWQFRYTFPFEGNWNDAGGAGNAAVRCSDIPSRLKGIGKYSG